MEKILDALLAGIRNLGIEAVIAPQQASANRPRVELYLAGIEPAGIDSQNPESGKLGWERIIFNALFKSEGTHIRWVNDTILALREISCLHASPLSVMAGADQRYILEAVWRRIAPGHFEYPDTEESSMPVRYVENWEVSIAYPARIIGQSQQGSPEEEI